MISHSNIYFLFMNQYPYMHYPQQPAAAPMAPNMYPPMGYPSSCYPPAPFYPPFPRRYKRKQKRRYYVDDDSSDDEACPPPMYYPSCYGGMYPYMQYPMQMPYQHPVNVSHETEVCDDAPEAPEEEKCHQEEVHHPQNNGPYEDEDCDSIPIDMIDHINELQRCEMIADEQKSCELVGGETCQNQCVGSNNSTSTAVTQTNTVTTTNNASTATQDDHKVTFVVPKKKLCPKHQHHNHQHQHHNHQHQHQHHQHHNHNHNHNHNHHNHNHNHHNHH